MKRSTKRPPPKVAARPRKLTAFQLQRILVPLDFSEDSLKALRYALRFAEQFGARITLVHVVEPMIYPPDAGFIPLDQTQMVKASKRRMAALAREAVPAKQLERTAVVFGNPAHEIASLARRRKFDLIVLSTHGYTGLQHVLLGSTAERVVRHAPCPVLVVRQNEKDFVNR